MTTKNELEARLFKLTNELELAVKKLADDVRDEVFQTELTFAEHLDHNDPHELDDFESERLA